MIQSKQDLKEYIEADLIALNKYPLSMKEKLGGYSYLVSGNSKLR